MKAKFITTCSKDKLKQIRKFIEGQIKSISISRLEKDQIILAVDEACSNAIIHGNNCDENKELQLELEVTKHWLKVEILDIGTDDFNQLLSYQKNVSELVKLKQPGGMGLKLIHAFMDKVNYYRRNNENVCLLVKNFK